MALPLEELDDKIEALSIELEQDGINTIDYIVARMGWDDREFMQQAGLYTARMVAACISANLNLPETFTACYTNGILHGIIALLDREDT